jgi:hypothetical protein
VNGSVLEAERPLDVGGWWLAVGSWLGHEHFWGNNVTVAGPPWAVSREPWLVWAVARLGGFSCWNGPHPPDPSRLGLGHVRSSCKQPNTGQARPACESWYKLKSDGEPRHLYPEEHLLTCESCHEL